VTPDPFPPVPPDGSPSVRTRVKICGITTPHDALLAQSAGADAIGMIFAPRSARLVSPAQASAIVAALGPFITKVGVFVDADLGLVEQLVDELRLDAVQLHGAESPEYAAALTPRTKVVRALRFADAPTPTAVDGDGFPADAFLLDGAVPGSGTVFDWSAAAAWRGHPRLVLAGGLTPVNVAEAIAALRPYAVDVASGVESSPRTKDPATVRRFIAEAGRATS